MNTKHERRTKILGQFDPCLVTVVHNRWTTVSPTRLGAYVSESIRIDLYYSWGGEDRVLMMVPGPSGCPIFNRDWEEAEVKVLDAFNAVMEKISPKLRSEALTAMEGNNGSWTPWELVE